MLDTTLLSGHLHGDIWKSNVTLDLLAVTGRPDTCEVDSRSCMAVGLDEPEFWSSGVAGHWIPVALMWFIYKLVFIGIHPVDRLALQIPGNPPPGHDYRSLS